MEWLTLENVFLILFLVGLIFTIISALLSGAFEHEFGEGSSFMEGDAGSLGGDPADGFHGGGAEVGWDQAMLSTFSPLSPTVIASFITAAGGMGYVGLKVLEWDGLGSSLLAIASGLVFAAMIFFLFSWVFGHTQGSSIGSAASLVGNEAEVTLTIPAGGTGEIAWVLNEQRFNGAARSGIDSPIPQGCRVVIKDVSSSTYVVEETRESWLARQKAGSPGRGA